MPVNKNLDVGLNDAGIDLDELDKAARKAYKALEKKRRETAKANKEIQRLEGRGGIFGGGDKAPVPIGGKAPTDISKSGKTFDQILDEKVNVSFREAFADQAGGFRGARNIFSMAKNPKAFVGNVARSIPFIGGLVAAAEFAQAIVSELKKIDNFLKKFIIKRIDDRNNQLRERIESAHISAGNIQEILTTEAGGTSPRESYNTFNLFNENRTKLEADYAVRDKSGI